MPQTLLLTSFDVWEPHHVSNSSDDLLAAWLEREGLSTNIEMLRKLPVDSDLATQQVLAKLEDCQPDGVICCGMAEGRSHLTVESNGKRESETLPTSIDLDQLVASLETCQISHDAGAFVCNDLYYSVLQFIQTHQRPMQALFMHVPLLTQENLDRTVRDFAAIVQRLGG